MQSEHARNLLLLQEGVEPRSTKVNLADLPDEALAARVQDGDEDAAEILFLRYWPLGRALTREGGIVADWQELYGDVFLACVAPGRFDPARGRFKSYFRQAMVNEVKRTHQRRRRSVLLPISSTGQQGTVDADRQREPSGTDDGSDEQRAALRDTVRELVAEWEVATRRSRERRRWAAIARSLYLEDHTFHEAAHDLGVSLKTIHNCLSRHVHPAIWDRLGRSRRHETLGEAQTEAGHHAMPEA
jgi:DNA-directed RNA polymerase specialized sigma24 family protein